MAAAAFLLAAIGACSAAEPPASAAFDSGAPDHADASVGTADHLDIATATADATGARVVDAAAPDGRVADSLVLDAGVPDARVPAAAPYVPLKILPMGDSITKGVEDLPDETNSGGYRAPLFALLNKAGRPPVFVGSAEAGPATVDGVRWSNHHSGRDGYMIAPDGQGNPGWQIHAAAEMKIFQPDIVLLHIGSIDARAAYDLPGAPARLAMLVDTILEAAPNARLIVAQIIPWPQDDERTAVINRAIPALVAARQAAGKRVSMVDLSTPMKKDGVYVRSYFRPDLLHPTVEGFAVMAAGWYAAIRALP